MFKKLQQKLFGRGSEITAHDSSLFARDDASIRISELNMHATRHKESGDLDSAIDCLTQAKGLRWKAATHFPIASWLRLPLFLQAAGRMDDAMLEFQALLDSARADAEHFHPQSPTEVHEMLTHAHVATIYDKMRLACKREKRTQEMERYAELAEHHRTKHKRLLDEDRTRVSARLAEHKRIRGERRHRP